MTKDKGFLDILILSCLWGPSYFFIKTAVVELPPFTLTMLRMGIAVILLYGVLKLKRIRLPNNKRLWMHCFVVGLFVNTLPSLFFNFSLLTISTSLSALINGTTPIMTLLLANNFLTDERLNLTRGLGILLGCIGFLILFLPPLFVKHIDLDVSGMVFSFLGAVSYAIANVYARKYVKHSPPYVAPVMQLSSTLIYMVPLAFLIETPIKSMENASLSAWGSLLSLAFLGTTLAFVMFYRIIQRQGATALAMVTYLLPIIGTLIGVVFLQEKIGLQFCLAAVLILLGIMIVNLKVIRSVG
jgi:drug/metabolite transporter (DMT)-like permease